jgi:hypothetical protein
MEGSSDELRLKVGRMLDDLKRASAGTGEDRLGDILRQIHQHITKDLAGWENEVDTEEKAARALPKIDSWLSLVSHAVNHYYAPLGRSETIAGWNRDVAAEIRGIATTLQAPLRAIVGTLEAISYSIEVGLPDGISLGISWKPGSAGSSR